MYTHVEKQKWIVCGHKHLTTTIRCIAHIGTLIIYNIHRIFIRQQYYTFYATFHLRYIYMKNITPIFVYIETVRWNKKRKHPLGPLNCALDHIYQNMRTDHLMMHLLRLHMLCVNLIKHESHIIFFPIHFTIFMTKYINIFMMSV